jgi:hypothetical protein
MRLHMVLRLNAARGPRQESERPRSIPLKQPEQRGLPVPDFYRAHVERVDQSTLTDTLLHFLIVGHFDIKLAAQRVGLGTAKLLKFFGQS